MELLNYGTRITKFVNISFGRRADPKTATHTIQAHDGKLNCVNFNSTDRNLLSAGRDNSIRYIITLV
jgi:hypothetical protein